MDGVFRIICVLATAIALPQTVNAECSKTETSLTDAPEIRMSQIGLHHSTPGLAILSSHETTPIAWTLVQGEDSTITSGETIVFGESPAAGEHVHQIHLPSDLPAGDQYQLKSCAGNSRPFAVTDRPFVRIAEDSLSYFFQNRSGIAIDKAYVPDPQFARAAGHVSEVLSCYPGTDMWGTEWPGCDHALDVTGGWYDAGDFGKYAVNGGISTWMLLNAYERLQKLDRLQDWPDGRVPMPENGNGLSEILDEARWEVEFLLSLQVPQETIMSVPIGGQTDRDSSPLTLTETDVSGMVHHKVHAPKWPALPLLPSDAKQTRYLYPPSTGATLNVAAVAAQCARIWRDIDPDFAERCLAAATSTYEAAKQNTENYARRNFDGGGPYNALDLSDEFAWAAMELYATTGEAEYVSSLAETPGAYWLARNQEQTLGDISWNSVDQLPLATLLVSPVNVSDNDRARAAQTLIGIADQYLEDASRDGYGLPYPPSDYGWGSNGAIASRALALGYAYDSTSDAKYRQSLLSIMDYLTGRNPLDQSFIAGHGDRAVRQVHHRFWAEGANADWPPAAPGALSGGPNAGYEPYEHQISVLCDCAPMSCCADDYTAFAFNEVAINWNAALFWLASYLDTNSISTSAN